MLRIFSGCWLSSSRRDQIRSIRSIRCILSTMSVRASRLTVASNYDVCAAPLCTLFVLQGRGSPFLTNARRNSGTDSRAG
jgi:hypothetical protein